METPTKPSKSLRKDTKSREGAPECPLLEKIFDFNQGLMDLLIFLLAEALGNP